MEIVKQHIKKIYYWVIILVVIVALALVYVYTKSQRGGELTEKQKQEILNKLEKSNTSTLTEEEKLDILQDLSAGEQDPRTTEDYKKKMFEFLSQQQ